MRKLNLLAAVLPLCCALLTTSCQGLVDSILGSDTGQPVAAPTTVPVASVTLDKTALTLAVGETAKLSVTVTPANTTDADVDWDSSDLSVAEVDGAGIVTAVAIGTATITVKAGGKTAECTVTVAPALEITAPAIGQVVGDDGKNYEPGSTLPEGVKKVAVIVDVDGNGGGLALSNTSKRLKWDDAMKFGESLTVFAGVTWRLPTNKEWDSLLSACSKSKYGGLYEVWGAALEKGWSTSMYWTSTPGDIDGESWAWWLDLDNEGVVSNYTSETSNEWTARPCFVF